MNNNNDTTNPRPTTPQEQIFPLRPERNLNAAPLAPDRPAQIARPKEGATLTPNNQTPNNSTNNASVTNGNPRGR